MDNSMEEQSEDVSMLDNKNPSEECCSKLTEIQANDSNTSRTGSSADEFVRISDRNETGCNDAGTVAHVIKEADKEAVMDLLVKLGNDPAVYNISKSLERVRYMINNISVEDILSSILPYQRCVTYISGAQKTIKSNQKENVFKFVSSYPSSDSFKRKYRARTGVPVIIIGDVTNIQEDQCSYVFICTYVTEGTALNSKAIKDVLGTCSSSTDESSDSSDDGSSTVDSSEDSSSSDDSSSDENEDANNKKSNESIKQHENFKPAAVDVRNPLVFLEDGAADKLPPVRECDMKVPKQDCIEIGYVMHIHELLVSVQGLKDSPALNADTLLFLEDNEDDKSLRSLGFIYEVIGPVGEPVYCVTFKEELNLEKKQVKQGAPVYIHPSPEHTHFVFVQDLLKQKGSDASWKNDVEPPEQFVEYSDDEEERLAKQRLKQASVKESSSDAAVKRKHTEENSPEKAQDVKQIKVIQNGVEANTGGNGCMPSVGSQLQPRTRDRRRNRIASRSMIGRGQQMPHAARVNGEVGNRNIPSIMSPGSSDNQRNGIGSYCGFGRAPRATQVNSLEPRMQHYKFTVRPAGLATVQQPPPRTQQYTPAPAVNRPFLPRPPASFTSNQQLAPPLQQQGPYFNSPSYPRCTPPFPPPQRQFYNPPQ